MKNQKKKGSCDSYRDKVTKTVKDVLDGNALSMHDRLEVLKNGLSLWMMYSCCIQIESSGKAVEVLEAVLNQLVSRCSGLYDALYEREGEAFLNFLCSSLVLYQQQVDVLSSILHVLVRCCDGLQTVDSFFSPSARKTLPRSNWIEYPSRNGTPSVAAHNRPCYSGLWER